MIVAYRAYNDWECNSEILCEGFLELPFDATRDDIKEAIYNDILKDDYVQEFSDALIGHVYYSKLRKLR